MWKPREGDRPLGGCSTEPTSWKLRDLIDEVDAPVVPYLPGASIGKQRSVGVGTPNVKEIDS